MYDNGIMDDMINKKYAIVYKIPLTVGSELGSFVPLTLSENTKAIANKISANNIKTAYIKKLTKKTLIK